MILEKVPIRIRLSMVHGIWMGIVFTGLGVGLYRIVEDNLLQSLDAALLTSAKSIRDSKMSKRHKLSLRHLPYWESVLNEFFGGPTNIRAFAQMVDTSGTVKAKTGNIRIHLPVTPRAFRRAEKGFETYEIFRKGEGPELRQVTLPVLQQGRFVGELIQVAASMDTTFHTLEGVKKMLLITLLLGLFLSIVFGYVLTSLSFRPVARITKAASTLGVTDLNKRLKLPPANDELRVLIQTFNEMLDRLEDAFSRMRRFAGNVSHELRTPIAVMRGEAELALKRERKPVEYANALKVIQRESDSMSGIVEDLLLLARAQGRSLAMKWESVNIDEFLATLEQSISLKLRQKNIDLMIANSISGEARFSTGFLSLVLKNILLNACRHSPEGGRIEFKVWMSGSDLLLEVADFGAGIAQDFLPFIFDTFYRVDSARNRNSGGVGIGLSLAQALVRLHGGELHVESELGFGAKFTTIIPQEQTNADCKFIDTRPSLNSKSSHLG